MSPGNMNAVVDALAASLQQPTLPNSRLVGLTALGQASATPSRSRSSSRTGGMATVAEGVMQTQNENCKIGQINMWAAIRFGQTGL